MDTPSDTSLELELDTPHVPLSTQVGGHPGILTTEDGSLLIKPALPTELAFYQLLAAERKLQPLREYVPAFLGTLKLEGALDPNAGGGEGGGGGMSVVEVPGSGPTKDEHSRMYSERERKLMGAAITVRRP